MLATAGTLPTDDDAWAYEVKWDGVRALVAVDGGRLTVTSRNGNDVTSSYPELAALGRQLGSTSVLLDGEVVAFDAHGPHRLRAAAVADARRAAVARPCAGTCRCSCCCSTCCTSRAPRCSTGRTTSGGPRSRGSGCRATHWSVPPAFLGGGAAVLEATRAQGLEGVVAKRRDARRTCPAGAATTGASSSTSAARPPSSPAGSRARAAAPGGIGSLLLGQHGPAGLRVRRARRHRLHRGDARDARAAARAAAPRHAAVRHGGAARARPQRRLGRAGAGRRGGVHRVDARRAAAAPVVQGAARRRARRRRSSRE